MSFKRLDLWGLVLAHSAALIVAGCGSSDDDDDASTGTSPTPDTSSPTPDTSSPTPDASSPTPGATSTPDDSSPTPTPGPSPSPTPTVGCDVLLSPSADDYTTVQTAFIESPAGSLICFNAGKYTFGRDLSISTDNVTVRGLGDVRLDFKGQIGANAINITGDNFTIQDITVLNPKGDGIRATAVDNVTFLNVSVIWENGPQTENGGYGLYPVQSNGVLILNSMVTGASDAGIYVGQSNDILVKDNEVYENVAGIEIENCYDSEVTGNHAHDNTGGILVFNLPGLDQNGGARANVHHNLIEHNNTENFAEEGNIVAVVPQGTGVILLAADHNEIHHNDIRDNQSAGIAVVSYTELLIGDAPPDDFDAYAEGNYIHDNTLVNNGTDPQDEARTLVLATLGPNQDAPQLIYDGCTAPVESAVAELQNCFMANVDGSGQPATYGDMQICNDFPNNYTTDMSSVNCTHESLPGQDGVVDDK